MVTLITCSNTDRSSSDTVEGRDRGARVPNLVGDGRDVVGMRA